MYEVLSVIPSELKELRTTKDAYHNPGAKIEVRFNKAVELDELLGNAFDLH